MEIKNIECIEWVSVNRNARLTVTQKEDNFKKSKSQKAKNSKSATQKDDALSALYLIQIAAQRFEETNLLACLTSDQVVNVYNEGSLKSRFQVRQRIKHGQNLNEVGFYKTDRNMIYTCGDDGSLRVYDMRVLDCTTDLYHKEEMSFNSPTPREFLCADINADDSMFAIGTNKNIDDAIVFLFDVRFNTKHLHKLCESHSMDITQVKFHPSKKSNFCSGSTDGLVCLYDINESKPELTSEQQNKSRSDDSGEVSGNEEEDPDFMDQVFNTNSSIVKLNYLSSTGDKTNADQLCAITYTNGLFVWDLASEDQIYRSPNNTDTAGDEKNANYNFFIDCFYKKNQEDEKLVLTTCMSDIRGNINVYQSDNIILDTDRTDKLKKRFHKDIIRSSYWNGENLYTCGEDGFLLKWDLSGEQSEKAVNLKQKDRRENSDSDGDLERLNQEQFNKKVKFQKKKLLD